MKKKSLVSLLGTLLMTLVPYFPHHNNIIFDEGIEDCTWKEIKLYGKVQFVESFPDIKIQFVNAFPELKVKYVDAFPDDCGEWQIVESFPDFKVQVVESFPDIKIKIVESFPGTE